MVMMSFRSSSVAPCSRMSESIIANRSLATCSSNVSGTSNESGRIETIAFCSSWCTNFVFTSSTSLSTPSRSFSSSSAHVMPDLTLLANSSLTSASSRLYSSRHSTSNTACLPASCGADVRGGKVTEIVRVSPFLIPVKPSTSPYMNLPGCRRTVTPSPPAICGKASPFEPSAFAKKPFMFTRSWLSICAPTPSSTSTSVACWSRSLFRARSYASWLNGTSWTDTEKPT
mmetsp:Transcript_39643/g.98180  ORF Transcript_39643/g.98180 Transcript_39643/m.98180 type:complete len:229 (-) Transcript_39643:550-1236(-)